MIAALRELERTGARRIEVTRSGAEHFDRELRERLAQSVWHTGCTNWYVDEQGNDPNQWPSLWTTYKRRTSRVDPRPTRSQLAAQVTKVPRSIVLSAMAPRATGSTRSTCAAWPARRRRSRSSGRSWSAAPRQRSIQGRSDFVWGGAGLGDTMRANREAFRRRRIVPRMLRDVSQRDLRTTVLGTEMPAPVMLAPVGVQTILHPDGELASARAAAAVGLPVVASTAAARSLEEVAAGSRRRAALVPALLSRRTTRSRGASCGARGAGRLQRDRDDARFDAARLAPGRPGPRVPAVPRGHRHRAVRDRRRVSARASSAPPERTCRARWRNGRRSSTRS